MTFDNVDFTSLTYVDNGQTKVTRQGRYFVLSVLDAHNFTVWQNPGTGETIVFEYVSNESEDEFMWVHAKMYSSLKGRDETKFRKNVGIIKACERGAIVLETETANDLESFLTDTGFSSLF